MNEDLLNIDALIKYVIEKEKNKPHFINILEKCQLLINYFGQCTKELGISFNISTDIPDMKWLLLVLYLRSKRLFSSIVLLLIFGKVNDAHILCRSFLENILQTKFLINDQRGRAMRKMQLHEIFIASNVIKEIRKRDENRLRETGYKISTTDHEENINENLKYIEDSLSVFSEGEIIKEKKNYESGKPWFGRRIKRGLMEYNLDNYFGGYSFLCRTSHCQDVIFAEKGEKTKRKYAILGDLIVLACNHVLDLEKFCLNTFNKLKIKDKLNRDFIIETYALASWNTVRGKDIPITLLLDPNNPDFINGISYFAFLLQVFEKPGDDISSAVYDTAIDIFNKIIPETDERYISLKKILKEQCDKYEKH